jgi:hypothetical protein
LHHQILNNPQKSNLCIHNDKLPKGQWFSSLLQLLSNRKNTGIHPMFGLIVDLWNEIKINKYINTSLHNRWPNFQRIHINARYTVFNYGLDPAKAERVTTEITCYQNKIRQLKQRGRYENTIWNEIEKTSYIPIPCHITTGFGGVHKAQSMKKHKTKATNQTVLIILRRLKCQCVYKPATRELYIDPSSTIHGKQFAS